MKSVLQVFAFDSAAKVLMSIAALLLIRFMPESEYAVLTLVLSFSAGVVQAVPTNLNCVYIVGYKKLNLSDSPQLFLALELWLLTAVTVIAIPFASMFSGVFWIVIALTYSNTLLEFVKTFYQNKLQFVSFGLIEAARGVLYISAIAGLVFVERNSLQAWQILSLQTLCMLTVVLIAFGKRFDLSNLLNFHDVFTIAKTILKSKLLFMIGYFFILAFLTRIDVLMLEVIDTKLELATYGSAFKYYGLLMIILAAMHTVYLPVTQQLNNRKELGSLLNKHQRMIVVIVPVIVFGAWLSRWIIPFIDGGKYPGACDVFRILSISAVISLFCSPHANVLFRYDAYRFLFFICCGGFVLNLGLNRILIPQYHSTGAAWATLTAIGMINALIYIKSKLLIASTPLPKHSSSAVATG